MNNLVIRSDNLDALKYLYKDYAGKIDVMPIDPPYNTAIDYIGYKDCGFAEGWDYFMKERLDTAYGLLSDKGVMFIHIDENEFTQLWSLCSGIFGKENIMTMIWKKTNKYFDENRREKALESGIRRTHEFILVCFKNRQNTELRPVCQPYYENGKLKERLQPLETVVDFMGTTASAKDELRKLMGEDIVFPTPKPVKMIKEFIRSASDSSSVILDFFAGSGTTGQAVMELNKEDGGKRKFILVTNDENGIFEKYTVPRIMKTAEKYGLCAQTVIKYDLND